MRSGAVMSFVVAVSGGRDFKDTARVWSVLDEIHAEREITLLIEGECPAGDGGADERSRTWAKARQVNYMGIPPKQKKYGWPKCGPMRNEEMGQFSPHLWVLFPGGRGTDSARRIAAQLGIKQHEVAL